MTAETSSAPPDSVRRIPLLVGFAAALVALAALGFLWNARGPAGSAAAPLLVLQQLGTDATRAFAANDTAAVDRIGSGATRLQELAAASPGSRWSVSTELRAVLNAAEVLQRARPQLLDAGSATRESRDLVPRLLAQLNEAVGTIAPADAAQVPAAVERFESRALRLQGDIAALASKVRLT